MGEARKRRGKTKHTGRKRKDVRRARLERARRERREYFNELKKRSERNDKTS